MINQKTIDEVKNLRLYDEEQRKRKKLGLSYDKLIDTIYGE